MVKSQLFSDILRAYNNIFPDGIDSFDKVLGKSNCTAYGDIAILALYRNEDDVLFINSCSKNDCKFPIQMLKDIIKVAKKYDNVVLTTTRKNEVRRLADSLGAFEFENGFYKGVL